MNHPIYRVRSVKIVAPYTLQVGFDDGAEQTIDFRPVLAGELYGPLRALAVFNAVKIDPKSTRWFGRTARTLIQPRFTTGRNMWKL